MESNQPRKLFVGGLREETTEKDLEEIFCEFGHLEKVLLLKHRQTKISRCFAFIIFERPAHAQWAAKEMNGKCLDGKEIKVEPTGKPSYNHHDQEKQPPFSRNKVTQRRPSFGGGGSSRARVYSSCKGPIDDGRSGFNFNMSSSRRHLPGKRCSCFKSGGPPPRRSDRSAEVQSSCKMREGLPLHGGDNYEVMLQRNPVSFQRDDYTSSRDDSYSHEDRGDHLNSQDMLDFARLPREYGYHNYGHYSLRDDRTSRSYSGCGGYDGSHDRHYHSSGSSYIDDHYGNYHSVPTTPEFPRIDDGKKLYVDDCHAQHEYSRRGENSASSQSDTYYHDHEYGGRRERDLLSSKELGYHSPHES
ncbi:RNA-binding motif protein, X chromosome-like [Dipodomys merriami]|uniref:RNA-binding motif protein, X chromosome-like n=1 Tax=Dipodomys merriami TaxID=94247 RepID=UPI00384B1732